MMQERPFIVVKQLRVRDLRDDDIVLLPPETTAGRARWTRWVDVDKDKRGARQVRDGGLDLVDVQVPEPELPIDIPVPVTADPAYLDALRGGVK